MSFEGSYLINESDELIDKLWLWVWKILIFNAKPYHTSFRLNRRHNLSLHYRKGHARYSFRHRKPRTHLDITARRWWEAASPYAPCSLTCSSSQRLSNHMFAFRCQKTNRLGNESLEDPKTERRKKKIKNILKSFRKQKWFCYDFQLIIVDDISKHLIALHGAATQINLDCVWVANAFKLNRFFSSALGSN